MRKISIEDLLKRYLLSIDDATNVAIYSTDGTLIAEKNRS